MPWYDYVVPQVALSKYLWHRAFPDAPTEPKQPIDTLPRTDEGIAVPLVYGRTRVRTPILAWSGNYLTPGHAYTYTAGPSAGTTQTPDHYALDMVLVLGIPFYGGKATLIGMTAGDTPLTASIGVSAGTTIPFTMGAVPPAASKITISGVFYQGTSIQDVTNGTPAPIGPSVFDDGISYGLDTSLASCLIQAGVATYPFNRSTVQFSGMRSLIVAFGHFAIGTSPSLPSWGFEIKNLSTGSSSDLGNSLADDADPAAVIYDLLTSPWGKVGLPASMIDLPSFQAASATLFAEGNGYSRTIEQPSDASAIIVDILKQINGTLYQEPTTGLIVLKLIRNDYDVSTLDDINPDNCEAPGDNWYSVQGWAELPNQVRLTYTERNNNYNSATVTAQNPAGVDANGGRLRSISVQYPGCCTAELARKLASRDLATASRPLAKATVKVTRAFYEQRPGDVVTLTWPELGINKMVMRITRVNRGRPGASAITLDLIRDAFDVSTGAYPRT